jgi:two-component system CheB/CheR fusion protein
MEMQLRRLMRELQHRVKNMLANVIALVNRARGEHGDPKIVMEKLVERIKALAATHNLLTAHDWRPTGLVELLRPELTAVYGDKRIVLRGPAIQVNARTTLGLSMAIHELATNAAKYGSLSVPDGMLSISWLRIDEGEGEKLRIKWEEKFGPEVVSPRRYGFGTQLVKTTVEGSFGGTYESEFEKGGLTCTISLPIDRTTEEEGDAAAELEAAEGFVR